MQAFITEPCFFAQYLVEEAVCFLRIKYYNENHVKT